ncbi:hypothetical protein TVAG_353310 [Trichomonas vaginalis G3]|uniref:DUS-like FMN-binding domain-containing protein n=1 Tax=Trichomonas vaginalis (strain ATCC PRA-98 / G3) TaxID=412133 RepID=A2EN54_TRIV3|nr:tRNA dihydrouridine synthase protein [Trichomonas vaginalis G3]EAY05891.1 hypothetical protein TVAG_353310 [Trichomonas vaginalis G3]KAI5520225.1 tRNA dihydrouridine synthase protein [Trichomonas vaginalis G3]|eukprot:XP_001318114.1 hypothetical protein [Trichomonas vaginalis G3]
MNVKEFWKSLGEYPVCLAPMVEMGDIAFRILCHRHGCDVCWTGMINGSQWNRSKTYRQQQIEYSEEDRPLVIQISGSIDVDLLTTAKSMSEFGVPIDINLGCCQKVAKRGEYGYFMVDSEQKRQNVVNLIKSIPSEITVPLYVKIRALTDESGIPSIPITVDFAKHLEEAGASLITIHGRSAAQDKHGPLNKELVKAVVQAVSIPVIVNGGINSLDDARNMIRETGAIAAMSAQSLLMDPTLFDKNGRQPNTVFALEYLDIFEKYHVPFDVARRHFFYFFDKELGLNGQKRAALGRISDIQGLRDFVGEIERQKAAPSFGY